MTFPSKATHQQTRAYNAALVLRALYDFGPISRAEVARLSGLTRTTVGDVIGVLMEDGLAREVGRGPSTGGKAPILLELIDGARHVIGLDLGENVFVAALLDLRGQVQRTIERPVVGLDGKQWLEVVHELIDELSRDSRATLLGIGVGTPGIVDAATGTILWAVNLDWQNLPLGEILRARHGVPVEVANDSRAAALAIELFSGQRRSNLVAIKVGLGVGAGVILGGELFHGDGFGAGEIGHVVVEDDGGECRCGRFGCLETVSSSRAILERATEAALHDPESPLGRRLVAAADGTLGQAMGRLTLDDVRTAIEAGDEEARRIVVTAGRFLGRAVAGIIGMLDIEHIVLHGSVAQLGEPWLEAVRDEARSRSLGLLTRNVAIELAPPIGDLVVMGASALLLTAELGLASSRAA
ncbi:MAG TPA: ROK family transcriptional regulator [Candidatus Limnocylindrales bacterium]